MKKGDEIKIHRVENGFTLIISSGDTSNPARVYVYNHYTVLLTDMEKFLSREEIEESVEERLEIEAEERRKAEIMEE